MGKHVHADLIKDWVEGAKVQIKSHNPDDRWVDIDAPDWAKHLQYRIKPTDKQEPMRKWVGLTDKEIIKLWESDNGLESCDLNKLFDFSTVVRFITKKIKEKNNE